MSMFMFRGLRGSIVALGEDREQDKLHNRRRSSRSDFYILGPRLTVGFMPRPLGTESRWLETC
ncbi:hypothetical protein KY284_030979 [Solanum tuberosum]|nr:hypothetical protein KY284_030979 [Solanum tuberosum]